MFNPKFYKNKSYDLNFTNKNMSYMPLYEVPSIKNANLSIKYE